MILVKMNGEVYAIKNTIEKSGVMANARIQLVNLATGTEAWTHFSGTRHNEVIPFKERCAEVVRVLRLAGAEVFGWDDEPIKPPASIAPHLEGWRKFNADVAKLSADAKYENHPECPHCGKDDRDWADGYLPVAAVLECEGCGQEYAYSTKVCLEFETSEVDGNEEE